MLTHRPTVRIITREVVLGNGELALAFFAVINRGGAVEVRFLGTKPAPAPTAQPDAVLALPEAFQAAAYQPSRAPFSAYKSPFVSTLSFFINQLTRAPSLA
jgi:hypothetical protein